MYHKVASIEFFLTRARQDESNLSSSGMIITPLIDAVIDNGSETEGDRLVIMDAFHGSEIDIVIGILTLS